MTAETPYPWHDITSPENLAWREHGLEVARSVDGEAAQAVVDSLTDISLALAHHIAAFGFGDAYSRPDLDPRSRQFVTIGAPTALGGCEPQLRIHIGVALNAGLTREGIVEVILHVSVYASFPRVFSATFAVHEIFAERDTTD